MAGNTRIKLLSTQDIQECGLYFKLEYPQNHKLYCGNLKAFTQFNILVETRRYVTVCRRISFAADLSTTTILSFTWPRRTGLTDEVQKSIRSG
jgi:hypothetical protein